MTNKKFKLAAMSLATAVAVSAVGPSASAVTYYLGDGSVTVDKDEKRGAYSYQGDDGSETNRTYVNEDEADHGVINVKDGHEPTKTEPSTDNSDNGTAETTSTDNTTDPSGNNTENSSTSETTTGNTITVKEDVKDATIVVDGVNVDTSTQTEVPADAKEDKTIIKVGEGANTKLTISGGVEKTETAEIDTEETESPAGGSLTISDTTGGLVMADGSDVEITDGANVTIEETKTSGSTQAGRGVTQHGDLTISGGSSLTIDGVEDNAKQASHTGVLALPAGMISQSRMAVRWRSVMLQPVFTATKVRMQA